jgi:uncharacterized protein YbdZ (MbtH family)
MTSTEPREFFQVIVNRDRCYSIWPISDDLPVPPGWASTGFAGSLEVALNQIAEQWRSRTVRTGPDKSPASTTD